MRRWWALVLVLSCAVACSNETSDEDDSESSEGAQTAGGDGVVYFHGMSKLGFSRTAIATALPESDWVAPQLSDAALQSTTPPASVSSFLQTKDRVTAAGYSLGRAPVLSLMKAHATHLVRAVLIDPTYDGSSVLGSGVGGAITKVWLDGDEERTFMLVYGDVTKQLHGEASFMRALDGHPRAQLCYVAGDHARFRQDDMTAALVAHDCAELATLIRASR